MSGLRFSFLEKSLTITAFLFLINLIQDCCKYEIYKWSRI